MHGEVRKMSKMEIVDKIIEKRINEVRKELSEKEFFVTDLVACYKKREFRLKYPVLSYIDAIKSNFILGYLVHRGIQSFLKEEFSADIEVSNKIKIDDYVLHGRIDAIIGDGNEKFGVEIKTARSDVGIPQEHHIDQAKIYNFLFDLPKTILLYVSPDRFTEFVVSDRFNEEEILNRMRNISSAPRYSWECKYCIYSQICSEKKIK